MAMTTVPPRSVRRKAIGPRRRIQWDIHPEAIARVDAVAVRLGVSRQMVLDRVLDFGIDDVEAITDAEMMKGPE